MTHSPNAPAGAVTPLSTRCTPPSTSRRTWARSSRPRHRRLARREPRRAGRALGAVGAGPVTATFYNYSHDAGRPHRARRVGLRLPRDGARRHGCAPPTPRCADCSASRRSASDEMAEAAGLALRATEGCTRRAARSTPPTPTCPYPRARTCPVARGDPAARTPRRRPPRRPADRRARPGGGPGQPHRHRPGHDAELGDGHPRLAPQDWTPPSDRLRERGLLGADGELTEEGAGATREAGGRDGPAGPRARTSIWAPKGWRGSPNWRGSSAGGAGAFPADLIGKADVWERAHGPRGPWASGRRHCLTSEVPVMPCHRRACAVGAPSPPWSPCRSGSSPALRRRLARRGRARRRRPRLSDVRRPPSPARAVMAPRPPATMQARAQATRAGGRT